MLRRDQFYSSGWKPALTAAGLAADRFVFHACRHWYASTLLAEGAPLSAVAGHLGDTVETVSRTYVHWLRDDRDVPAEILDRMLGPRHGRVFSELERGSDRRSAWSAGGGDGEPACKPDSSAPAEDAELTFADGATTR
jgi:hypothetical protein